MRHSILFHRQHGAYNPIHFGQLTTVDFVSTVYSSHHSLGQDVSSPWENDVNIVTHLSPPRNITHFGPSLSTPFCIHQTDPLQVCVKYLQTPPSPPSSSSAATLPDIMDADSSSQWRFAQCFGDKGEVEDITEGSSIPASLCPLVRTRG